MIVAVKLDLCGIFYILYITEEYHAMAIFQEKQGAEVLILPSSRVFVDYTCV